MGHPPVPGLPALLRQPHRTSPWVAGSVALTCVRTNLLLQPGSSDCVLQLLALGDTGHLGCVLNRMEVQGC